MNDLQTIQSKIYEPRKPMRRPIGFVVPGNEAAKNTPPEKLNRLLSVRYTRSTRHAKVLWGFCMSVGDERP